LSVGARIRASLASCREVEVVYGEGEAAVHALAGVSVAIAPEERIGLLGRSGSGKTTLLHVLGGLVEPSAGTVEWKARPLLALDRAARSAVRAHGIAYVFQGANLLPHFTAFENVAFAAHLAPVTGEHAPAPHTLLELVGLAAKADHLPAELSGGEAQRVALARALAQRPELLLCDEPTGHLDSDTAERVLDLIDALHDEFGFALLLATHDPAVAARLERFVELEDGRIVAGAFP
jgi:predicted ABC-type transport system involved in lysophospholipase L1 biosynthesis ATPase subunit